MTDESTIKKLLILLVKGHPTIKRKLIRVIDKLAKASKLNTA